MTDLGDEPAVLKEEDFGSDVNEWPDWEDEEEPQKSDSGEYLEPNGGITPTSSKITETQSTSTGPEDLAEESESEPAVQVTSGSVSGGGGGFFAGDDDSPVCEECERRFQDSWLLKQFDYKVCDECRDRDGKHSLITKTDAKNEYFLKDADFDVREPPLKCISKKNPHNVNWGTMKLFLKCQVEERALEVWGTEEAIEAEREKRDEKKVKSKKRTFDKMIKELRMNARSSLGKQIHSIHQHDYADEEYDEDRDVYSKKCKTCEHVNEYEKM